MIRRAVAATLAAIASVVTMRAVARRGARRLLDAPGTTPDEASLAPALDALGGEVVRFRSRDGLRLTGRWLPADAGADVDSGDAWRPDPYSAILLLHGWSGSSTSDLVEFGPFLRGTASVLGLDFRGHGGSDPSPSTFGLREVEDVAGALTWLGQRGIERVALVGSSMGGITALAAVAVLGDGSLTGADADPAAPASVAPPRRPRIVAVVADSVPPEISVAVGSRLRGPGRRLVAGRLLDAAARQLGGDPRETEPIRVIGLLEGTPLMLISGEADTTVPIADARRLATAAPAGTTHLVIPGADHGRAHATDPATYERAVTAFLRAALTPATWAGEGHPIIATPGRPDPDLPDPVDVPDPA